MTVGQLVARLLWLDWRLPVVFKASEEARGMPVEITEVDCLSWLPPDALVARGAAALIVADARLLPEHNADQ